MTTVKFSAKTATDLDIAKYIGRGHSFRYVDHVAMTVEFQFEEKEVMSMLDIGDMDGTTIQLLSIA